MTAAARDYQDRGLPARARRFFDGLCSTFNTNFDETRLSFASEQLL